VRYRIKEVLEWQKSCLRVVPENWQPVGSLPGENMTPETDQIQWIPPGAAAIAIEISLPTMTAWRKRSIGVPFIWIGGGGVHQVMYDRHDIDVFIARRHADPSVLPVIEKKKVSSKRPWASLCRSDLA
jgi:hypothetical protein